MCYIVIKLKTKIRKTKFNLKQSRSYFHSLFFFLEFIYNKRNYSMDFSVRFGYIILSLYKTFLKFDLFRSDFLKIKKN